MNYALVFAGGVGTRMNLQDLPKQFLPIQGKPIIIYTIEHFDRSEEIDAICVVCVDEWIPYLIEQLELHQIKKVNWVVSGGKSALESQYLGLQEIARHVSNERDHIVLIHDGVRPLINGRLISECIECTHQYGSAVTTSPAIETIARADQNGVLLSTVERSECLLARAPQCFFLREILSAHEAARASGNWSFVDSATMMLHQGKEVHVVQGPPENIKVTTPIDYYVCKALLGKDDTHNTPNT